jgi:glycosyltransferase involved in cell wall biosynthesis
VTVRRLLVVAQDRLGDDLGGTGIRALEIARELAGRFDVTLAGVGSCPADVGGLPCVGYLPHDPRALKAPLGRTDAVLSLPAWPLVMDRLRRSRARLVFDLYVPQTLETISGFPGARPVLRQIFAEYATDRLIDAIRRGEQFICASEKQRDLWLGAMAAERLITTARYDHDSSLRSLIDVVPFGVPPDLPRPRADRGVHSIPGIVPGDEVVIWNGGLWPWLDPFTAIRAIARVARTRPRVRLLFMGAAPQVPAQRTAQQARELARGLGLMDRAVFFNERWVPYEERGAWLLGANCALSTHGDHVETRFAFRTRLLDCFWARLPVVCTGGDELADTVEREGLGAVVPAGDEVATAEAIEQVLGQGRDHYRESLVRVSANLAWSHAVRALVEMLEGESPPRSPHRATRPSQALRGAVYRAGRVPLNAIGVREWPRL